MLAVTDFNYTDFKRHVDLRFRLLDNGRVIKTLAPVECPANVSGVKSHKVAAHLCPEESDILLGKTPESKRELLITMKVCDKSVNDFCE